MHISALHIPPPGALSAQPVSRDAGRRALAASSVHAKTFDGSSRPVVLVGARRTKHKYTGDLLFTPRDRLLRLQLLGLGKLRVRSVYSSRRRRRRRRRLALLFVLFVSRDRRGCAQAVGRDRRGGRQRALWVKRGYLVRIHVLLNAAGVLRSPATDTDQMQIQMVSATAPRPAARPLCPAPPCRPPCASPPPRCALLRTRPDRSCRRRCPGCRAFP